MKAAIMAVSALLWMTGCNRENKHTASAETAVKDTAASVKTEARQTADDAKGAMATAKNKVGEEAKEAKEAMNGDHGKTPADVNLTAKIRKSLTSHKSIANEAEDIHISADNGMVMLTGTVTSDQAKKEIARIVANMAGKNKVKDDLKVAERVGAHSD